MGKIEIDHTGSGGGITLSSDGTSLLLDGSAVGGGSIDDNGNATAITIDTDETVLIGKTVDTTSTPGTALYNNGQIYATVANSHPMVLTRNGDDGAIGIFYKDTTEVVRIGTSGDQGFIHGAGTDTGVFFGSNNLYPYRSTGLDNATIDIGQTNKRFRDIYLSGGIQFDVNGEFLDDYEEGTWTPVFISKNGTSPTGTFAHQGSYTKIGRQVHVIAYMQVTSGLSRGSGILAVNGLPFTAIVGDGNHSTGAVTASTWNISRLDFLAVTHYDSTSVGFLSSNNNGSWSWENTTTLNDACYIRFSLTYHTTQ